MANGTPGDSDSGDQPESEGSERKLEPEYIFRTSFRTKNGKVIRAANYGKKSFKFPVNPNYRKRT
jgi:hypothetical protein